MRSCSIVYGVGSREPLFRKVSSYSGMFARFFTALMLVGLSSCGGGSSSPTVALSNMVPVQLAMHLPGQAVAQADLMDKVLDLAIPDANAIVLVGVTSVTVTISGNGFTTIVDSFPAGAPGTQLVRQYSVPQGAFRTFSIQGFNTPVGAPAAAPVISGATTVPTLVAGGTPVVVDVVLNPTTDRIAPVVTGPAPIIVPAVDATGTPKTNAAIAVFLASATATDNVDVNPAVTNNAPLQFPLGPTTVTFTSTDLAGNVSTPVPVVVTIADQSPPVITLRGANPLSVAQGSVFNDPGSVVSDNVDVGLVAGVTGVVNTAVTGPVVLTYNVSDAAGNPAIPVQRTVIVNGPPAPTAPGIATNANTAGTSQIAPNDPNPGNTHTYAVTTQGVSGAATVNAAGLATYTPNNGFAGADSFVVTVTDQGGLTGTVTISVTVNAPPNQAPLPTAPAIVTIVNTAGTSQIAPNDPNAGNTHTYAITTQGVSGAATVNAAGLATYTPNNGFAGADSFVVTVTDQGGLTGAVTISVTVNAPPNQAPLPTAPGIVTNANTAGTSQIAPNDPNAGNTHTYAITTQGVSGAATVNAAGLATYTPNNGFAGADSFVVTVTDQGGLTGTVTISVTVNAPPNQAPAPTAPAIVTNANTAGTSQIAPNDPNIRDTHTYAVTTQGVSGAATVNAAGLATYTPNNGFAGADSFVVTVTDQGGLTGTVTIPVNVIQVTRQMQGVVKNSNGTPIQGATVTLTPGTNLTATTDVNGVYTVLAPLATYTITATKTGFTTATATFALTAAGSTTVPVIFLPLANAGTGGISGTVKNAINNTSLAGVTLDLRLGVNAPAVSPIVATATSSAIGAYPFTAVAAGTYTVTASKTGFANSSITVTVSGGATATANPVLMSAVLPAGQTRIILSWGAIPTDLDSHLVGPLSGAASGSQQFHVYFGSRGSQVAAPFAQLNSDVTSGFGPETITVSQTSAGTYRYYTLNYSNQNNAASTVLSGTSNAVVQVFQGAAEVARFNVPVTGAGDVWHVFDMDGQTGAITAFNQIALANTIPTVVTATPATATIAIPATQQITASVKSLTNSTIQFTGTLASSSTAVASVSSTGLVTSLSAGTTNITATEPTFGYSAISAITVTSDITPPTILSNTPTAGATGVLINSPVKITFSEPMNTTTITPAAFTLNETVGAAVAGTISFNATGTVATFVPTGNLPANTNYTVTLTTTGMTDIAGNPVATASPFSFTFTTGALTVAHSPVLPVVQGPVTNLGNYDGFSMLWNGVANGANQANRWSGVFTTPTTTITGLASFSDGAVVATVAGGPLATKIGANRIIQLGTFTSTTDNLAASVSLDGQFIAATNLVSTLTTVEEMLFVKRPPQLHTAATIAGLYNTVQFMRTPGTVANITSTAHGVLTINANGTWAYAGMGTALIDPGAGAIGTPFAITDSGTFLIDANGTGVTTSLVNQNLNTTLRTLVSADGNYIVVFKMDSVTRVSGVMIGVRQHATTVNVANMTVTTVRFAPSEAVPFFAMRGEVGMESTDANGLLNITHGSVIDNGVVCGVGTPPNNCSLLVNPATTLTAGANGVITFTDTTGATFSGIASQNGNVFLTEDPGRSINIAIKQ